MRPEPATAASSAVPRLQVIAAAALFSTGGAAIKLSSMSSWQIASFRAGIAALALLFLVRSRPLWSRRSFAVSSAHALTMILFVWSNKLTTAANAIFLQSTAPLYVLLLGPWLLGERIRGRDLFLMPVLAAGLGLFFVGTDPPFGSAPEPRWGNALAASSGLTWALTLIGLRWLAASERSSPGSTSAALIGGNAIAFAVCLPMAIPIGDHPATDWIMMLYLGVFQIALAYVLLSAGLRRLSALESSLLILLEPVLNPVWAWLLHGEMPGPWSLAGGSLVLAGTSAKVWWDSRGA